MYAHVHKTTLKQLTLNPMCNYIVRNKLVYSMFEINIMVIKIAKTVSNNIDLTPRIYKFKLFRYVNNR